MADILISAPKKPYQVNLCNRDSCSQHHGFQHHACSALYTSLKSNMGLGDTDLQMKTTFLPYLLDCKLGLIFLIISCSLPFLLGILKGLDQGCTTFCYFWPHYFYLWSTAANEFELYLWDSAKYQPTQNTFKHKLHIHSLTLCDITIQIVTHRVDWFSCLAFVLHQYMPAWLKLYPQKLTYETL